MSLSRIAQLVGEKLTAGLGLAEVFSAAEAEGHDLADVLDVLAEPFASFEPQRAMEVETTLYGEDVIRVLAEHGGLDEAVQVVERSRVFRGVDVQAHYAGRNAVERAAGAITDEVDPREAYSLVVHSAVPRQDRDRLVERMAHVYPLAELSLIAQEASARDADIIGTELDDYMDALSALESLVDEGELDTDAALATMQRFFAVPRPVGDSRTALLSIYVSLCREDHRSLGRPLRFAARTGEPEWWLPILREGDLKGSQAALCLLQSGADRWTIAKLLSDAGYRDDDVLTALLENGIGTRTSLATLREAGWRLAAMVDALATRGALVPQVRDHLEDLGVPRSAQRALLLEHWESAVVDLVLDTPSARTLPTPPDRHADDEHS